MNAKELALLSYFAELRDRKPSHLKALGRQSALFWVITVSLPIASYAAHYLTADEIWRLVYYVSLGALFRDIGWNFRFRRDWPCFSKYLDWDRIVDAISRRQTR